VNATKLPRKGTPKANTAKAVSRKECVDDFGEVEILDHLADTASIAAGASGTGVRATPGFGGASARNRARTPATCSRCAGSLRIDDLRFGGADRGFRTGELGLGSGHRCARTIGGRPGVIENLLGHSVGSDQCLGTLQLSISRIHLRAALANHGARRLLLGLALGR
jgi:hypothetical protein